MQHAFHVTINIKGASVWKKKKKKKKKKMKKKKKKKNKTKKATTSNIEEKVGAFSPHHHFPSFLVHRQNRDEDVGDI